MAGFNRFERQIAKGLEQYPFLRNSVKELYKRSIYWVYRKSGCLYELHPQARFMTPQEWAGISESGGEWFFGYYDKSPWSQDQGRAVFHKKEKNCLQIMVVDRQAKKEIPLGTAKVWNWQQGAMAQWISGETGAAVIFNTLEGGILGSRRVDLNGENSRFIEWPIQTLHPNGKEALTLNYRRLQRLRPDYGYSPEVTNFSPDPPLDQDGVWHMNLESGEGVLLIRLLDLASVKPVPEMKNAWHKVNHLIYSPSGERFVFLHRFMGDCGKYSRLFSARPDGSGLRLLLDERMASHYHWKDDTRLLVWGRTLSDGDRYYLIDVVSGNCEKAATDELDRFGDGHCTFSPDKRYILTDTYPDRARHRKLILFDTKTREVIQVGSFFSPWKFDGVRRCDLHPRFSPDGNLISIDSAHEGVRKTYFIDVNGILAERA